MRVSILNMFSPLYDIILQIKLDSFFVVDDSFLVWDRFTLVLDDGHPVCLLGSYFYFPVFVFISERLDILVEIHS